MDKYVRYLVESIFDDPDLVGTGEETVYDDVISEEISNISDLIRIMENTLCVNTRYNLC